jgi:hypothetical protein
MSSMRCLSARDGDVKWIPVRAAAKLLQVSRQRVARLCKTGGLLSVNYDGTVLVSLRSVENRLAGSGKEGR